MQLIVSIAIAVMIASAVFLLLRSRTFFIVMGLIMLSYGVNFFLFCSGRLAVGATTILDGSGVYTDPLPQALVLTAIVIGFAMTAFLIILSIRASVDLKNDHVDGLFADEEEKK